MAINCGKKHRIVSSVNGPKGESVGRIVIPTHVISDRPPHTLWGEYYHCEAVDPEPFKVGYGGSGGVPITYKYQAFCHCPEDWLEEIIDPEETKTNETKEELTA